MTEASEIQSNAFHFSEAQSINQTFKKFVPELLAKITKRYEPVPPQMRRVVLS
jgi:hypothetical protein